MDKYFTAAEELFHRLIRAIESQNALLPANMIIPVLSLVASWITIWFLLRERYEKNRPYLQISFEPVRSTLACIVLRNTGNSALDVKSLVFNKAFIEQLPAKTQVRLLKEEQTNITIFPNRQWVISFDTNVFDIIKRFDKKSINIDYTYTKHAKSKSYFERTTVDFDMYSGMLVYLSESDELKNSISELSKVTKELARVTKLSHSQQKKDV